MYQLIRSQYIHAPVPEVWRFFSSPANLAVLTPDYMDFKVKTSPLPAETYKGEIIEYTVRPILGIPLFWQTEITELVPESLFVDNQNKGPYKLWHHEHRFAAQGEGTLMTDTVSYELPLGPLGRLAHAIFVRKQLEDIFAYREAKVNELFPEK